MELHTLKPAKGSIKKPKRVGRGEGSGMGGTSTKGHNGAQSRAGYKTKQGGEGGQNPLQRRIPKYGGLKPKNAPDTPINLQKIADLATKHKTTLIDTAFLVKIGAVKKNRRYKILGSAPLPEKIQISAHGFSKSAQQTIEKHGGVTTLL